MTRRLLISLACVLGVAGLYFGGVAIAFATSSKDPWVAGILALPVGIIGGVVSTVIGMALWLWWGWVREG